MGLREWGRRIDEQAVERLRTDPPPAVSPRLVLLWAAGWLVLVIVRATVVAQTDNAVIDGLTVVVTFAYVGGGLLWARRRRRPKPPRPASGP